MSNQNREIVKMGLFNTPNNVEEIEDWINQHPKEEHVRLWTVMGMTWNFLTGVIERDNEQATSSQEKSQEELDSLAFTFQQEPSRSTFEALLKGYQCTFGDKYEMVLHCMFNHMNAEFYDYLCAEWGEVIGAR